MLSESEQRDARALAVYLLAGDVRGTDLARRLLTPRKRAAIARAFEVAAVLTLHKPRMISFAMTTEQVKAKTKTVTRRVGWLDLKPGTILQAVEKGQGLKKGEKVKRLCLIRVVKVSREPLCRITRKEVEREGFPGMMKHAFVAMFCEGHGCAPADTITRIEFEYV